MIPFSETRVLDANSEHFGTPGSDLMENAGKGAAEFILQEYSPGVVLVVCGPGNNGGDGLVAARYLSVAGVTVTVLMVMESRTELSRKASAVLPDAVEIIPPEELAEVLPPADLVVDAMLGVGVRGGLREPYPGIVKALNDSGRTIVSLDVPTGMGTPVSVRPGVTVTFHDVKEGMDGIGRVEVVDIGIPPEASTHTGPGELTLIPSRRADGHKGSSGKVLIVGGGPFTGAPALAAMSALRTGTDLTVVMAPGRAANIIATFSPNIIARPLPGDVISEAGVAPVVEMLGDFDAVVIGPGMGSDPRSVDAAMTILDAVIASGKTFVVDADALRMFIDARPRGNGVLTPHMGEFRRIVGEGDTETLARELSEATGMTVLLKGREDLIVAPDRTKRNATGNPGMTVGGTGDVLAGAVGALLGMGMGPFDAARVGAYVVGSAGDMAFEEYGNSLLATDVIETIPAVLKGSG